MPPQLQNCLPFQPSWLLMIKCGLKTCVHMLGRPLPVPVFSQITKIGKDFFQFKSRAKSKVSFQSLILSLQKERLPILAPNSNSVGTLFALHLWNQLIYHFEHLNVQSSYFCAIHIQISAFQVKSPGSSYEWKTENADYFIYILALRARSSPGKSKTKSFCYI